MTATPCTNFTTSLETTSRGHQCYDAEPRLIRNIIATTKCDITQSSFEEVKKGQDERPAGMNGDRGAGRRIRGHRKLRMHVFGSRADYTILHITATDDDIECTIVNFIFTEGTRGATSYPSLYYLLCDVD